MDKWIRALQLQADVARGGTGMNVISGQSTTNSTPEGKGKAHKKKSLTLEAQLDLSLRQLQDLEKKILLKADDVSLEVIHHRDVYGSPESPPGSTRVRSYSDQTYEDSYPIDSPRANSIGSSKPIDRLIDLVELPTTMTIPAKQPVIEAKRKDSHDSLEEIVDRPIRRGNKSRVSRPSSREPLAEDNENTDPKSASLIRNSSGLPPLNRARDDKEILPPSANYPQDHDDDVQEVNLNVRRPSRRSSKKQLPHTSQQPESTAAW